jgi:hypothetical protein
MKKEIIKVVSVAALCLGLFGAGFVAINSIVLASATEGTHPLQLAHAAVNIPVSNVAQVVSEEHQKPEMVMDVIFESDTVPSINALSPKAAAEIGAGYIWEMFGESIDGRTVRMIYSNHPSSTRTSWLGIVFEDGARLSEPDLTLEERMEISRHTLFHFSVDAITGEWIDVSTSTHLVEPSEEVRAALVELHNRGQGRATEEAIAIRSGGAAPTQLDIYIEAVREFASRQFTATEIVSVEFRNANAISFDLDENGNLFATDRQLTFEVVDSTGRVADVAIVEATRELIWLHTGSNDIVPGFNYNSAEPGRG